MFGLFKKSDLPAAGKALPGRDKAMPVASRHPVTGNPLAGPYAAPLETAMFGMGCFWGVERLFWERPGVWTTAVGYAGGVTPNPTYREVCSGRTGHNEVVRVVFDPSIVTYGALLRLFWERHDPTQGMRQGPDRGTQYRSGIYAYGAGQRAAAEASRDLFQRALHERGLGDITTEIAPAPEFHFAEDHHQQYLQKHPGGYCSMRGSGALCPTEPAAVREPLAEAGT